VTVTEESSASAVSEYFWPRTSLSADQMEDLVELVYRMEHKELPLFLDPDFSSPHPIVSIGLAAYLYARGEIDQVIILCKKESTLYWTGEFEKCTAMRPLCYHGSNRHKKLASVQPNVIVSTHETLRGELIEREKVPGRRSRGKWVEGDLATQLKLGSSRTLWIFDGVERVEKRSAEHHQAYVALFKELRKGQRQRFLVLLNDPPADDPEAFYNIGRLFLPEAMPTVAKFEQEYCMGRSFSLDLLFRPDRVGDFLDLFGMSLLRSR
jgi:hypothetical protein